MIIEFRETSPGGRSSFSGELDSLTGRATWFYYCGGQVSFDPPNIPAKRVSGETVLSPEQLAEFLRQDAANEEIYQAELAEGAQPQLADTRGMARIVFDAAQDNGELSP